MRQNKYLHNFIKNEKGNVFILVALYLVVLLGIMVLVIDVGSLYLNRRQVVNAADAAALAGAQEIVRALQDGVTDDGEVRGRVETKVIEYLGYHDAELIEVTEQDGSPILADSKTVKVIADKEADLYFAPAFYALLGGQSDRTSIVGANATAKLGYNIQPKKLVPFAIPEALWDSLDEENDFTLYIQFHPGQGQHEGPQANWGAGNWGTVNFEESGSPNDKLANWLMYGYDGALEPGDTIWTAAGVGLNSNHFQSGNHYPETHLGPIDYHIVNESHLIVPIVEGTPGGSQEVTIVGFSTIQLISQTDSGLITLEAELITKNYSAGKSSDDPIYDFGLETASLIE